MDVLKAKNILSFIQKGEDTQLKLIIKTGNQGIRYSLEQLKKLKFINYRLKGRLKKFHLTEKGKKYLMLFQR
jgi:hypothetical protein